MSSKLNPNAGAFVPSFVVPIESAVSVAAPSPASKKNKANGQNNKSNGQKELSASLQKSTTDIGQTSGPPLMETLITPPSPAIEDLTQCGQIINGRQYYSIQELLLFRPLCTSIPPLFDAAAVHAICGGITKEKSKTSKREKQRAATVAQNSLHYDPNAYSYYPSTTNSDRGMQRLTQRHQPTENPEQEARDAIEKVHGLLDLLATTNDMTLESTIILFQNIPVTCTPSLQAVVSVLFDRAIAAPHLSNFYASFCSALSESLPDFKDGARTINFRRILLTKCYEALVEETSQVSWRRQSMVGNVGLIGELFRRQLLTENIMHVCVAMMLDTDMETLPSPEVLQAACHLLLLVGDLLDGSSPASRRTMDEYFDALQRLACHEHVQLRLRQLILETLEARSTGWLRKRVDLPDVLSTTQSV